MSIRNLKPLLIASLFIIATRFVGQTALTEVCLTPAEYRFYAGCLIDRQALVKDTARLYAAIGDLKKNIVSLESEMERWVVIENKLEEKVVVLEDNLSKSQDEVDKQTAKKITNRKLAIIGWGIAIVETAIGVVVIWAAVH